MRNFLQEITLSKQEELTEKKRQVSLESLKEKISGQKFTPRDMRKALVGEKLSLIAEIKLASPSAGNFSSADTIDGKVKAYEKGGADAISLVTEKKFFKGDPAYIARIKTQVSLPVLQKDFIIDPYQIYEAKLYGADALLLIVRLLTKEQVRSYVALCLELGIEPIVEIHNEADLEKTQDIAAHFIAVNARDLSTFTVDLDAACHLMRQIPNNYYKLGFSGVSSSKECAQYAKAGAAGVLVGTSAMKAEDPETFLHSLKEDHENAR